MNDRKIISRLLLASLAITAFVLLTSSSGCPSRTLRPDPDRIVHPPPLANSPAGVLRLLEWSYDHRSLLTFRELFTADFRFVFTGVDSAGAEFRGLPWTFEDELICTTHMFVGGGILPPARRIALDLDRNFFVRPDPRHATSDPLGRWHKQIRTQVVLTIRTLDGRGLDASGATNFYLVRGDSALIPDDLIRRGFHPDSSRWYIQRWEDETSADGARSWGAIKLAYREPFTALAPPVARLRTR